MELAELDEPPKVPMGCNHTLLGLMCLKKKTDRVLKDDEAFFSTLC